MLNLARRLISTPITRSAFIQARNMASSTAGKSEWLVILPDQTGALSRRMEVRQ